MIPNYASGKQMLYAQSIVNPKNMRAATAKHNPTIAHHGYIRTSESRWGCSRATAPVYLPSTFHICAQSRYDLREPPPDALTANTQVDATQAQA